jgi:hypothetical protein
MSCSSGSPLGVRIVEVLDRRRLDLTRECRHLEVFSDR